MPKKSGTRTKILAVSCPERYSVNGVIVNQNDIENEDLVCTVDFRVQPAVSWYHCISVCIVGRYQGIWRNTGLSSSINWETRLLTAQSDIVTAHGMYDMISGV